MPLEWRGPLAHQLDDEEQAELQRIETGQVSTCPQPQSIDQQLQRQEQQQHFHSSYSSNQRRHTAFNSNQNKKRLGPGLPSWAMPTEREQTKLPYRPPTNDFFKPPVQTSVAARSSGSNLGARSSASGLGARSFGSNFGAPSGSSLGTSSGPSLRAPSNQDKYPVRAGDRPCTKCGRNVWGSRRNCFFCDIPVPPAGGSGGGSSRVAAGGSPDSHALWQGVASAPTTTQLARKALNSEPILLSDSPASGPASQLAAQPLATEPIELSDSDDVAPAADETQVMAMACGPAAAPSRTTPVASVRPLSAPGAPTPTGHTLTQCRTRPLAAPAPAPKAVPPIFVDDDEWDDVDFDSLVAQDQADVAAQAQALQQQPIREPPSPQSLGLASRTDAGGRDAPAAGAEATRRLLPQTRETEPRSGILLASRITSDLNLSQAIEDGGRRLLRLSDAPNHALADPSSWSTIGILAKEERIPLKDGRGRFFRWTLSDLHESKPASITLNVFDGALEAAEAACLGDVYAVIGPRVTAGGGGSSKPAVVRRLTVKVTRREQLLRVGKAADIGECGAADDSGCGKCGALLIKSRARYCLGHAQQARRFPDQNRPDLRATLPLASGAGTSLAMKRAPSGAAAGNAPPGKTARRDVQDTLVDEPPPLDNRRRSKGDELEGVFMKQSGSIGARNLVQRAKNVQEQKDEQRREREKREQLTVAQPMAGNQMRESVRRLKESKQRSNAAEGAIFVQELHPTPSAAAFAREGIVLNKPTPTRVAAAHSRSLLPPFCAGPSADFQMQLDDDGYDASGTVLDKARRDAAAEEERKQLYGWEAVRGARLTKNGLEKQIRDETRHSLFGERSEEFEKNFAAVAQKNASIDSRRNV